MTFGRISAKASAMTLGLGALFRKYTWQPITISKKNSNIIPYMCAAGRMETTREVLSIMGRFSCMK